MLVVGLFLYVLATIQVWDVRLLAVLALIAAVYYRAARIPFVEVRRQWAFVVFFVTMIVVFNTLLTGGELRGIGADELHVYFRLPFIGTPISAESVTYAAAQFMRFGSMAAMGFPIAFAVAPGDIGPTFARLGVPYKFAYGIDLTFRFIPSLSQDMQTTIDAQRIRGFEWDDAAGPIARLRRSGPLLVPVTINAIVGAEDTIDAMDLRAFGTGKRTWLRHLAFDRIDWLTLAGFAALFAVITVLSQLGLTVLWVPQPLIDLAG